MDFAFLSLAGYFKRSRARIRKVYTSAASSLGAPISLGPPVLRHLPLLAVDRQGDFLASDQARFDAGNIVMDRVGSGAFWEVRVRRKGLG